MNPRTSGRVSVKALSITKVNNVILIGQIETPLALALSVWLLKERINRWVISGAVLVLMGVAITVLLQPSGINLQIGKGELFVLIGTVSQTVANLISKKGLGKIPLSIFTVARMFVGTIIFFIVVMVLYGAEHFVDVTSPFLWQWMLIYSAIIVVGGQLLWFKGFRKSTASEVSWAVAFNSLVGILFAYVILQEIPTTAQYLGGLIIIFGIICNQIGVSRLNLRISQRITDKDMSQKIGFKGI